MGRARTLSLAVLTSLLSHAGLMVLLRDLPAAPASSPSERDLISFSVERPAGAQPQRTTRAPTPEPRPVLYGGPQRQGNLDRDHRTGQSGDGAPDDQTIFLFTFASPVTLQDTDLNNFARNQAQRIDTAGDRATQEQRRATPHPSDAVFLASGEHGHAERRVPAKHDSTVGAPTAHAAAALGSAPRDAFGTSDAEGDLERARSVAGSAEARPTPGIASGRGTRQSVQTRVDFARPNVDRGASATTAETEDSKVRDDMNAELLAAKLQRSIIDASLAQGDPNVRGHGGQNAARSGTSQGDRGDGATALPYAPGAGRDGSLNTEDARYVRWLVEQKARVAAGLVFPFARAIAKDQGTSLYRVIVTRSGTLLGPPTLIRSSGFADFDAAARTAIGKAVPFAPLPSELMRDRTDLTLLIPIEFENPMVE